MDVNSNKLGGTVEERNKRLVLLLDGIGDMNLGDYKDSKIDAFGDAYEYLMGMYASMQENQVVNSSRPRKYRSFSLVLP